MNTLRMRWLSLICSTIIIAGLVAGLVLLHVGKPARAHAASTTTTPTITTSVTIIHAYQIISVTAQGFAPNETVAVYFFYDPNIPPSGNLTCDNNGNCSGTAVAADLTLDGPYQFTGVGNTSGLKAQTPVTLIAGLQLTPNAGGQNTSIAVTGSCFALNETVKIYWGGIHGTFLGTASTDNIGGNWYFVFNAPTGLTAGSYTIAVLRTHQKPGLLVINFHYETPQLLAPAAIQFGQPVSLTVKGFDPNEQVTTSWNANGGQTLNTLTTDATGKGLGGFMPPVTLPGSYVLTATGSTSGFHATATLKIGPGIQLNPTFGSPGSTVTVSGGGFQANEAVQVFFQSKSNGVVNATTGVSGTFSAMLTLPKLFQPKTYHISAWNTSGSERAQAAFSYYGATIGIANQSTLVGQQDEILGQGFSANESVTLYWEYGLPGQVTLGTTTADSSGSFQFYFTTPSEPDLNSVPVEAIGNFSKFSASVPVYVNPSLTLQPASGPTGTQVAISGGGFGANETVSITLQNISGTVASPTTDSTGAFTVNYTIPLSLPVNSYFIYAKGATSGMEAGKYFQITSIFTVTPTTGTAGTKITVTGQSFSPSISIQIQWLDSGQNLMKTLTTVQTSATGTFKVQVTAPGGLMKGNTYYVAAYGDYTESLVAFVAQ